MNRVRLHESGNLRAREGGKWAVRLITPGTGSSGVYSEEMLTEFAPKAFKKGMKLWFGHPKEGEGPGDRDPRDQWGVLDEDATYTAGEGVDGKVRLLPHWKDVVESLGDQASLSIYATGDRDEEGNVTALFEDFTNSVDIVSYPGREGSGLKRKLEAARAASTQPDATSAQESNKQEVHMLEQKDLDAIAAIVAEKLKPANTFFENEETRRQAEADASDKSDDVTAAVEAAVAAVEAVRAAKVLPAFEEKLIESAKKGEDVTADLDFAKTVTAEAAKPAGKSEPNGSFVINESADKSDDLSLNLGGSL